MPVNKEDIGYSLNDVTTIQSRVAPGSPEHAAACRIAATLERMENEITQTEIKEIDDRSRTGNLLPAFMERIWDGEDELSPRGAILLGVLMGQGDELSRSMDECHLLREEQTLLIRYCTYLQGIIEKMADLYSYEDYEDWKERKA